MKYYATKWVLTLGIIVLDGESFTGMSGIKFVNSKNNLLLRLDRDVFASMDAAKANAVQKAINKAKSAKRILTKAERQAAAFQAGNVPVRGQP